MLDTIGKNISKQLKDIFELHFVKEEEKSDERKEKEKQIKLLIDVFTKALNLIVYFMLAIVIMRIVIILVLNPSQGIYEARKIEAENGRRKVSPMADTIRMKSDTIKMKNNLIRNAMDNLKLKEDSILQLKNEIAILKANTTNGVRLNLAPFQRKLGTISIKKEELTNLSVRDSVAVVYIDIKPIPYRSAVIDPNSGENYSLWKQVTTKSPTVVHIAVILFVLLILLWLMKVIMKLFYTIGNLISPFSIVKIIGLWTFICWIWTSAHHLFAASSLFNIADWINPLP